MKLPLDEIGGPSPGVAIGDGGPLELAPAHSDQPQVAHQPPDTVPADVDAFALELGPHLVDAVDVEVLLMHPDDLRFELGIPDSALRQRTSDRCVIGGGGELQDPADRLDPELLAVCRDVADYLAGRSSSAAKKADADFKMAFARRSSRSSFSNSAIRPLSSVVTPGRAPTSISACRTQFRRVCSPMPELAGDAGHDTPALPGLGDGLIDHPDGPLTQLGWVLRGRWSLVWHGSNLSKGSEPP